MGQLSQTASPSHAPPHHLNLNCIILKICFSDYLLSYYDNPPFSKNILLWLPIHILTHLKCSTFSVHPSNQQLFRESRPRICKLQPACKSVLSSCFYKSRFIMPQGYPVFLYYLWLFLCCSGGKGEQLPQTLCGPQTLKYLLSDPLQKKFAFPLSRHFIFSKTYQIIFLNQIQLPFTPLDDYKDGPTSKSLTVLPLGKYLYFLTPITIKKLEKRSNKLYGDIAFEMYKREI